MACAIGNANVAVGQRGAANRGESFVPHQQPVPNSQAIANGEEGPPLALFGALPITDVDSGRLMIARGQRSADTGVHAAAQEDHRVFCVVHHELDVISNAKAVCEPRKVAPASRWLSGGHYSFLNSLHRWIPYKLMDLQR